MVSKSRSTVERIPHPKREELELGAVLHALSDPVRLRIVAALAADGTRTCGSFGLPVTKSTCTHHFRVLREAGVISQRPEGTTRVNSLRRDDLEARFPGLLDNVLDANTRTARLVAGARTSHPPSPAGGTMRS
ncbi:MAG: ArsR/SmtB family transcription factor [Solirubrobacteraceae bacterium]|jgi:DNA-binding transcriptional ArsR family regulator